MSSAPASAEIGQSLFDRVGDMLAQHGLAPSPVNYALCHDYLTGDDPILVAWVDHAIARFGGLTAEAMVTLSGGQTSEISPESLQRMADEAQSYLQRVTGIVDASSRDVSAYKDALNDEAAALAGGRAVGGMLDELVGLTRAMIDKSRDAGEYLRRTGLEIEALRGKLVEARAYANSDALTGLPNRRALDVRMAEACIDARRRKSPLSIAICDIDNFKLVNDVHGHQVGDEVIKLIADALGGRGDTFVSRYGGEEFVVLFEDTAAAVAAAEVDRIRSDIAGRDIKVTSTGRKLGRISFSAGIAELRGRGGASGMLKRADAALYRAKHAGRDQVLTADD